MQEAFARIRCLPRIALLLMVLLLPGEIMAASTDTNSPTASGPEERHEIEKIAQPARVVVDTNAPVEAGTTNRQKSLQWDVEWRGWDGLHLEVKQRTYLPDMNTIWGTFFTHTNAPIHVHLDQIQFTLNAGGRVAVDGAVFETTGSLRGFDNSAQLRRAYINLDGAALLLVPMGYVVQLGYIPNSFYINESYLYFPNLSYIGNLQIGVFGPPMGLDLITSSRDITFMEPAAPFQAIGPANEVGVQIGHPVFNQRATWALGLFGSANTSYEFGNSSKNYGNVIGRLTWLAVDHINPAQPAENHLLHLGLSASYQYSASSQVLYRSRPESYIAPYVIDTGDIDASSATTAATEAAWVRGPFAVQGEAISSFVNVNGGSTLSLWGGYAEASWFLTGESRAYDPVAADFKRLIPRQNFNFGKDGWGAWQIAARFSHTDLTDGTVQGGRLNELMAGLNWYLNPHLRWMFNYGMGRTWDGRAGNGDFFIFQTRLAIDF